MRASTLPAVLPVIAAILIRGSYAAQPAPEADAAEIREALSVDEALLSFEVPEPERVVVHTRTGTRVYPLPPARDLESAVVLFVGLIANRDGSEAPAAVRLYRHLLDLPLREVPREVTHLVVVSDGLFQTFPFGALREAPRSEPIAARYSISHAPSVSTWLHWKQNPSQVADRPVLVLADPRIEPSLERTFGRLPRALRASRTVLDHAGEDSLVRTGVDASEHLLKTTDLSRFGVIHIASHAAVNDRSPERSSILLAAGSVSEDGMLRFPEVEKLDLEGRIVVLSGCETAAGPVLTGKGVQSLAHACLLAGAHAVIGSLWPVQDEKAGDLFDDFYHHLGAGGRLDEALALARRDRIHAGAKTAAWAGMVLLGDGSLVPFPAGGPARGPTLPSVSLLEAVLLGFAAALATLLRRRRPSLRPAPSLRSRPE